jgi:hypothetical protein
MAGNHECEVRKVPQQTNDDARFWEKFAYGFAGGLAPTLLKLAEFFNHSWNFPGWSAAGRTQWE